MDSSVLIYYIQPQCLPYSFQALGPGLHTHYDMFYGLMFKGDFNARVPRRLLYQEFLPPKKRWESAARVVKCFSTFGPY